MENIRVSHVNFTGTTNGARIKTWPGGTGYVRGIEFFDIRFSSVQNPIIIDQFYGCAPTCVETVRTFFFLSFKLILNVNELMFECNVSDEGSSHRESEIHEDEWNIGDKGGYETRVFRGECSMFQPFHERH